MDQENSSNSPAKPLAEAAAEGDADAEPSRPADRAEPDSDNPTFLSRILGWSGNGADSADDAPEGDRLGSAFRNSSAAELAMVHNIIRLRDLRVEDVMTPRADIVGVDENAPLDEILDASETGSHSRLPVYRETLDDPIGFVHMKDLALRYGFSRAGAKPFRLKDNIRTALFVPPSMRIAALLQKMQGERVHMALVIDEFGGVDGLVTIEDLVEQIVGDIEDEHDREGAAPWIAEGPTTWLVQARADIREFQEAEGLNLLLDDWEEDVDTLGGLVFMLANRVPMRGEVIVHPAGYEFEIVDAEPRRIKRLRLRNGNGSSILSQAAE